VIWCYKYRNLTSLVNDNFRVINGILLHKAVIVKPKHIVLLKKRVLTENVTVFIKFWSFDKVFTMTSRSKTIVALRLCVVDGNDNGIPDKFLSIFILRVRRKIVCLNPSFRVQIYFFKPTTVPCPLYLFKTALKTIRWLSVLSSRSRPVPPPGPGPHPSNKRESF
jgi:hypothetical protein